MLAGLEPASVDVIVTSPPYNLDLAYGPYRDRRSEADYLAWMVEVATALRRVMKPDASFFLNISGSNSQPWLPFELIVRLRPLFALQNHIAWVKAITANGDTVGHYKPVPGERYLHQMHEHLFHLTQDGTVRLDRLAIGRAVQGQVQHRPPRPCAGPALPRQCLVHPLSHGAEPRGEIPPSRHLPARPAALVHPPARAGRTRWCSTRSPAPARRWWRPGWRARAGSASSSTRTTSRLPRRGSRR